MQKQGDASAEDSEEDPEGGTPRCGAPDDSDSDYSDYSESDDSDYSDYSESDDSDQSDYSESDDSDDSDDLVQRGANLKRR